MILPIIAGKSIIINPIIDLKELILGYCAQDMQIFLSVEGGQIVRGGIQKFWDMAYDLQLSFIVTNVLK